MLFQLQNEHPLKMIISPFINHHVFLSKVKKETIIITRFNKDVFLKGSSNFDVMKKAFFKGNAIYNIDNLHSKIYLFKNCIITGSSNLTSGGLHNNQETNVLIKSSDTEYENLLNKINFDFNLKDIKPVTQTDVNDIENYLKINESESKKDVIKELAEKNKTKDTCDILVNPLIDIERVEKLCTKCFVKNENSYSLKECIRSELKKSNYQTITFDTFIRLAYWSHPKQGNQNPYKTAAKPALELIYEILGYIPLKSMVPRYYLNKKDRERIKNKHESKLKTALIPVENNFDSIWEKIKQRAGEQFYIATGEETFIYEIIEDEEISPLCSRRNLPKVKKEKIEELYNMRSVLNFNTFFLKVYRMQISYIFDILDDSRIIYNGK